MAEKTERTVRVRMREGMVMPLPSEIVRNSSTFVCTPETPIEVLLDHRFTRKRLESGDFEIVDGDPTALGLPETRSDVERTNLSLEVPAPSEAPAPLYSEPPAPNTDVDLVQGTVGAPDPSEADTKPGILSGLFGRREE